MSNLYIPELARIVGIKEETSSIRTITVSMQNKKQLTVHPGQFVEMTIFGYGEFPISVSSIIDNKGAFQTTVQEKGKATNETRNLKNDTTIGIRGPFGKGFSLEEMKGKNVYIVTGGIGLAAVWLLLDEILKDRKHYGSLKLLHGARKPSDMIYKDSFVFNNQEAKRKGIEVFLTVDDPDKTWKGNVGLVTDLFKKTNITADNAVVVLCGPSIMMKYASKILIDIGFDESQIILSMERRMQCGMGVCGHCMIGEKRVCLEGPVFHYTEIKESLDKVF